MTNDNLILKSTLFYPPVLGESLFYRHQGQWLRLGRLFAKLKKRPGKARILASVVVETKKEQKVRIVFIRHRHKRQWLAILSTKIDLADEEIVRIYGKRWDIEVFFKMMKHHLNLERETQLRDFDGIISHITIVMSRYVFRHLSNAVMTIPVPLARSFTLAVKNGRT